MSPQPPDSNANRTSRLNRTSLPALGGVALTAAGLLYYEQITWWLLLVGLASLIVLAFEWRRSCRHELAMVALDLAVIFLYAWSLGSPSAMTVFVRSTPHGFVARVDGQTFFQYGHARRIGLYSAARDDYVALTNLGRIVPGSSPIAWLANASRFAVPIPAWSNISLTIGGRTTSIQAKNVVAGRGSWSTNSRGEIAGSQGAIGWIGSTPGKPFSVSASLGRPDGVYGIVLDNGPHRPGYLLALRMDHRDSGFYHWQDGQIGLCTCSHAAVFPVQTVPMVQRLLRYFLPSLILAMGLVLVATLVYAALLLAFRRASQAKVLPRPATMKVRFQQVRRSVTDVGPRIGFLIAAAIAVWGTIWAASIALVVNKTLPTIEDTATYVFQAKTFALGRLWAPVPRDSTKTSLFTLPFTVISHGHWFGKYPPGWPGVLALGALFDKPWIVTSIVGGVTLLLIYLVAAELYSPVVGVAAAALALSSPFILAMSSSLLSQSATWMWCGLFAYLVLIWFRRNTPAGRVDTTCPRERRYLLLGAGASLALAFATRQLDAVTLSLPFLALLLRRPLSLIWVGAGGAIPLMLFAAYNLALTGDPTVSGYQKAFAWDHLGFGANVGGPTPYERGFDIARGFWNIAYDLEHLQLALFGWPFFFAMSLVILPLITGRLRRWDWVFIASSLCVVVAYGCYWASGVTGGLPRYWYAIVPWLCILAARGLEELVNLPRSLAGSQAPRWPALIFPAAFLAVMVYFDQTYSIPVNVLTYRNPGGAAVAAVRQADVQNAVIFQRQSSPQHSEYDQVFAENSPLLNNNVLWAVDGTPAQLRRVMAAYPGRRYYLLNGVHLTRLHS